MIFERRSLFYRDFRLPIFIKINCNLAEFFCDFLAALLTCFRCRRTRFSRYGGDLHAACASAVHKRAQKTATYPRIRFV